MNWISVLENVAVFAVASGLLAYLVKVLVGQALSREIAVFSAALNKAQAFELERAKNRFTIGATSHIADVAFDKHVLFCDEYVTGMFAALLTLYEHGPTKAVTPLAHALVAVRRKWAVWLTPQLEDELMLYENALFNTGIKESITSRFPELEDRQKHIDEMFQLFLQVIGHDKNLKGEPLSGEIATSKIIGSLRKVLGIGALTDLRSELIEGAASVLKRPET